MKQDDLVAEYGEYVSKLVYRMIHDLSLARDVTQEVWLEILNSIHTFNDQSQLSTWIYSIASRTVLKHSLKEKKISDDQLNHFFANPKEFITESTADNEVWVRQKCDRCVTSFLKCLNHEDRLMVVLHDLLELEYSEVVRITGKSSAAIRKQVSRSRQKLKGCISSVCPLVKNGEGKCHIAKEVSKTDLNASLEKLRNAHQVANELVLLDKTFPTRNFWEKFI